jgi:hypothetical protein
MEEQTLELRGIVSRVERLEKENRRLKTTGVVLLLLAGAVVLMGQAQSRKTIQAERFELIGRDGKTRGMLSTSAVNSVLMLYGPQASEEVGSRTIIGAGPSGPFVYLTRADGKSGVELTVQSGGMQQAALTLFDTHGTPVADFEGVDTGALLGLVTTRTGEKQTTSAASIVLFDKDKKVLWSAP